MVQGAGTGVAPLHIGLLFGGRSGEHEISISSARTVARGLRSGANADRYQLIPLYIDRSGHWCGSATAQAVLNGAEPPTPLDIGLRALPLEAGEVDVWFPVLHGPNGEDGTVQGLFRLMRQRFVGSGVLGSALAMDKISMKAAFAAAGLPQVLYRPVLAEELAAMEGLCEQLEHSIGYPCFVKPANLGSSLGISKAADRGALIAALQLAADHDSRMLVEQGLQVRELECAVLGTTSLEASVAGEVRYDTDWYDYETKYTEGHASIQIPAQVPAQVARQAQRLAMAAVQAVGASGLSRVDFFYENGAERLLLNEINTMPGFTAQSMYPMLWEASGLPLVELLHRLVQLA